MKFKRKGVLGAAAALAVIVIALLILLNRGDKTIQTGNLLVNGDFSQVDGSGVPVGWYTDDYLKTPGYTDYTAETGMAVIVNHGLNDARFAQSVDVQPDSLYCFSGEILSNAREGLGANLSIADIYVFSESFYDTEGQWQPVRLYGRTGKNQRQVTVFARLGGYSGESIGTASFRNLSLEQVSSVPRDYVETSWYQSASRADDYGNENGAPAWPWLVTVAALFGILCFIVRRGAMDAGAARSMRPRERWIFALMLLAAAAARLLIARVIPGYDVDIGCFTGWGGMMAQTGAANFYNSVGFCDYPPGYILVLGMLAKIGQALGTGITEMLVKLPSILCDIAASAVLYAFARKRVSPKAALTLAALYAFNPLTFAAGAAWGQADSVMTLFLMLTVIFALEDNWAAALPLYMLSVLLKPQALMFGPLGLLALIYTLVKRGNQKLYISAAIGLVLALLVGVGIVLPFSPNMDNSEGWWIIRLYQNTMGYYADATVNACNLYFLFSKNWIGVENVAEWYIRLLAAGLLLGGLIASGLAARWYKRGIMGWIVLCAACAAVLSVTLLPLPYSTLGTIVIVLSVLLCAGLYLKGGDIRHLPLLGATLLILLCNLGVMMHERYLFAAILLLAMACVLERDWRVYLLFAAFSITVFLNVGVVLDRGIRIGGAEGHLNAPPFGILSDSAALEYILSALHCVLTAFAGYTAVQICVEGKRVGLSEAAETSAEKERDEGIHSPALRDLTDPQPIAPMKGLDWLLMLGITAVYAVASLTNLGSATSPQTWWRSKAAGDTVVLDLGQTRAANLLYLGGIHSRDQEFNVYVSEDGENWSAPYWAEIQEGQCFKWQYLSESYSYDGGRSYTSTPETLIGRYVKIEARSIATTIYEVILRDPATKEVYPVSLLSGNGEYLIDGITDRDSESYWRSMAPGEQVTLDLGETRSVQLQFMGGNHTGDEEFFAQVSDDGKTWSEPYWAQSLEAECFQWEYLTKVNTADGSMLFTDEIETLSGRYVRLQAESEGLALYEVQLRDAATSDVLPVSAVAIEAERLIDEQDTFTGEPGWYNSTYFDEIYHARTAYEHYLAMRGDTTYMPYETSHPPLGKVLMAFSIGIFGMTPFGWRFAGALAGILMLPAMYLLGKLLTKRRLLAFAATFLMAVDFMHFTQTRIATIDSFVVLFILWSYVFMIYYLRMDYWHTKLWKTLIPLALSGLFMGLSVASKWTGCYAGVGLAVLFFWSLYRRFTQARAAQKEKGIADIPAREVWRRPMVTLASCLVFFIAVPLAIYYVSYIPYFLPWSPPGVTVKRVIQAAVGDWLYGGSKGGMLGYHSTPGLGMNHPFYSPWYQWPVIGKPMWYYAAAYHDADTTQTIVAFGNPAVWWVGLAAMVGLILIWALRHVRREGVTLHTRANDMRPAILLISFAAQYLPWVLVPRGTYIYHYFPAVPFIILATVLCLDLLSDRLAKPVTLPGDKTLQLRFVPVALAVLLMAAALALFIAFFPYISGITASRSWLQAMQWFRGWIYF